MNEELQQALAELINKSVSVGESAIAFTQEQLPEVIQQLLIWKGASSALATAAWFTVAIFVASTPSKLIAIDWDDHKNGTQQAFGVARGIVAGATGLMLAIACRMPEWIQIWLAPKVYLIEYAASLAK
jgi:hypothetical protein